MENIKRWYFKNGNFEEYKTLYQDECFLLVQNLRTKTFSFGLIQDFGSLYGFPVNQSCLQKNECINLLKRFAEIDKKYDNRGTFGVWVEMIKRLESV